jgi:predicted DNA-binding transcriptional regulator AlpA
VVSTYRHIAEDGTVTWLDKDGNDHTSEVEGVFANKLDNTTPEFLSIPELARRVGMSAEHLYRLARIGKLPGAIKLGKRYTVNFDVFVEASRSSLREDSDEDI